MDKLTDKKLGELFDKYCYDYENKEFTEFGCLCLLYFALSVLNSMRKNSDKF